MNKITSINEIERVSELKNHLRSKCEALLQAPKKAFFYGIADYVVFVSESKYTHDIITEKIIGERDKWKNGLAKLENPAVKELDKIFGITHEYIAKTNIKHPMLTGLLDQYEGLVQGRIQTSESTVTARFTSLRDIVSALHDLPKHEDFVKKYATITPTGLITEWHFSKAYKAYVEKEELLKSEREISWWWNWNELAVLFQVAYQANETFDSMNNNPKGWWDMFNFHGLVEDLKKATDESQDKSPIHFVATDYKYHLIRVNQFLLDNLQLLVTGVTQDEKETQEISMPMSTTASDYKSRFTYTGEGISYDGRRILEFPSYKTRNDEPIKRREIIRVLFENRQERVGDEKMLEGSPKSNSDLEQLAKVKDIHREMTRIKEFCRTTADSAHLELTTAPIKGSKKKYYLLLTRADVA